MPRYIDADVAYKLIQEQLDDIEITGAFSQGMSKAFNIAKSILHNQEQVPTADVQEVKHGEWKKVNEPLGWQDIDCAKCSLCGELFIVDEDYDFDYSREFFIYCPHCGAKMDGKD